MTLEDLARRYVRTQKCTLMEQLAITLFVQWAKRQVTQQSKEGVV